MSGSAIASDRAKQRVALMSLAAAVGILVFKLLVGLHTRSLGILAEAAHSGLDLLATGLTSLSLLIAARPADANHPFGHGKFENFSAFLESGLLVLTAILIAYAAVRGWESGAIALHLDAWAFVVMLTSMAVDAVRARRLRAAAAAFGSDALAADALNFSTDLASSAAVLVGLVLVGVGQRLHVAWLLHADAAAALVVAAAMVWLALRLGRRTAGVLLDEAPPQLAQDLRGAVAGVEDVTDLERLRLRRAGGRYFVDLLLGLAPGATLERAGQVRQQVAQRIQERLPQADIVVETEPRRLPREGPLDQVQEVARRHNLNIHDLALYDRGDGGLDAEFHLELRDTLPLADAHELVSHLEADIRRDAPRIRGIVTHIEPQAAGIADAALLDHQGVARRVTQIVSRQPEVLDCHDLQLRRSGGHLALSCHCSFADALPIARVHEVITQLEGDLKRALPRLYRVTIHPEPRSDNRR